MNLTSPIMLDRAYLNWPCLRPPGVFFANRTTMAAIETRNECHSAIVDLPYECLGLFKRNVRGKALRLVGWGERIRSDFESQLVASFEVEDGEDR